VEAARAEMKAIIETIDLSKTYRKQRGLFDFARNMPAPETPALQGVSLTIHEGEVFGLLGPNGSGKTTFLKLLSTILSPTSGTARVFGIDIVENPREVRRRIALVTGEERSLYWRLTAYQNLEFFARLYGMDRVEIDRKVGELLEIFDLTHVRDVRAAEFSTGMRQKLAIARGLLSGPQLLFLDEPTRGLDPVAAHTLLNGVKERVVEFFDSTVILTTHIMREVEQLCRRIAVLDHGSLAYQGNVDDLRGALEEDEKYTLSVRGLSERTVGALRASPGVEHCSATPEDDEVVLEIVFKAGLISVSDILAQILDDGAVIRRCTKREPSFEEMFRAMYRDPTKLRGVGGRS
jgi:ABC-2 type transport system ATP-binding protein